MGNTFKSDSRGDENMSEFAKEVVQGKRFEFGDIPDNRMQYLTKHNLKNNMTSNLRYVITHPLTVLDRVLMPIYEKMQLISNNYGIVVYVARKPKHG